jgi:flagellar biosynthesis protein FlhF
MKVRRYTGASLERIRETIVKELGENAVIIGMKKIEGKGPAGILGLGKAKQTFEVMAAADDAVDVDKLPASGAAGHDGSLKELIDTQKEQYRGIRSSIKLLDDKLADVDERVGQLAVKGLPAHPAAIAASGVLENIHPKWRSLLESSVRKVSNGAEPTPDDWHEALASILKTAGGIMFRRTPSSSPDVYVLVGPTGVGKTTTLAKLAAKCVLGEQLNVGLISMDTFRVGAVDQLREYASLLGIELAVAFSAKELASQLDAFREKDVVFIDTPGRSQFDSLGIKSISECLGEVSGLCTLLVVPASVRKEDAEVIVSSYGSLKPSALIISKTDEATRCDGLTSLFDLTGMPVVYLTDGQRVPEDIHVASPGVVASLVMPAVNCGEAVKIGDSAHA